MVNKTVSIFSSLFSNDYNYQNEYRIHERLEAERSISTNAFALAKNRLLQEYENLVDLTGLNVTDKENINLTNFDPNYVFPGFGNLSADSFEDEIAELTTVQNNYLNQIRIENPKINKHLLLTENGFLNIDITPVFYQGIMRSFDVGALITLLTLAGLNEAAIVAFTGAASSIGAIVLSIFNAIMLLVLVALITVLLITIVTIIVEHWHDICAFFEEITEWFYTSFSAISLLLEEIFEYVLSLVYESSLVGTITVGDTTFTQEEISFKDASRIQTLVSTLRGSQFVALLSSISTRSFIFLGIVTYDFCVSYKTHTLGFSSYTWFRNTARNLISYAGYGLIPDEPEINKHLIDNIIYMYHFHNLKQSGDKYIKFPEDCILAKTHSFFGPFYIKGSNGKPVLHEKSPIYYEPLPGGSIVS